MAKVPRSGLLFLRRLSSSAAAEQLEAQTTTSRKVMAATEMGGGNDSIVVQQKETFWMKDPKSGNWIPESHFGQIDVAEMREKFLGKTNRLSNR